MTEPGAKVIADSITETGYRLTTMEVVIHRFVLAEFNTHRVFSRNSASSRAIPVRKQIERVLTDPALPLTWPAEQSGMQGGEPVTKPDLVKEFWLQAAQQAARTAETLRGLHVHKSVTNRLLEPFMWHTVVVSSTEWENFFSQRCSPLAQPEIRVAAESMRAALSLSTPRLLQKGQWHLPYISDEEMAELTRFYMRDVANTISAARCARVSYLTHDGVRDWSEDRSLYKKLVSAEPPHASPLEHVARPCNCAGGSGHLGNFVGFDQLRHLEL